MACRWPGDKPLSGPMIVSLLTHTCVTRPQWVKTYELLYILCYFDCANISISSTGVGLFTWLHVPVTARWPLKVAGSPAEDTRHAWRRVVCAKETTDMPRLEPTASLNVVKCAYRALAKRYHPDKYSALPYNAVNFHTNIQKIPHSLSIRARHGVSFVDWASDLYSAPVPTVIVYAKSDYIGRRYNGTRLYSDPEAKTIFQKLNEAYQ